MKTIIILIVLAVAAIYFSNQLKGGGNKYSVLFVSWATSLLFFNIFISFFLYLFTHQIKKNQGEVGIKGKMGPRGKEGEPEICKFQCG